ncbi:hypothetical protein PanWU01x14_217150 [Parasponia andersonii]|uniref:Uncharacterized protein n=1 Tax=Parasponia andersonii TaxID=3476 RepID=A0A2P5BRC3_PARAD|nr:hypothetical protein PanWU01x14_217150 [Parasponia andersonii]
MVLPDGSHSYMFRQQEKHIDWMRIGAFSMDSSVALLTERLIVPARIPKEDETQSLLQSTGCCVLNNVKTGIWISGSVDLLNDPLLCEASSWYAILISLNLLDLSFNFELIFTDLQLVRCPVCDLNTCDGTMQTLDARHIELFQTEGYRNGSWEYELVGSHDNKKHADGASGAIFDVKHFKDCSTSAVFNLKSWVGKPKDWQPRAVITLHAVAVNTNLQKNEGLHVKYHAMRAGAGGEIVSIRISQQLL